MPRKYTNNFQDTAEVAILYEGPKNFWKSRSNLDIILVNHLKSSCIEVICYNSDIHVQSPRIYLNTILLHQRLDQEEIKGKLAVKAEVLTRQKKPIDTGLLTAEIVTELTINYIISRISIENETKDVEFSESSPPIVVMKASGTDTINETTQKLDVVFDIPPPSVASFNINFQKKTTSDDFHSAMRNLKRESKALKDATTYAEVCLTSEEEIKALLAERMREHLAKMRTYSVPRMRWVKAINWVLTQNFVRIVRKRCIELYPGAPGMNNEPEQTEEEKEAMSAAAALELTGSGKFSLSQYKRNKKLSRRSFDNLIVEKKLSANALGASESAGDFPPQRGLLTQRRSSKVIANPNNVNSLPPLDELSPRAKVRERRRLRRSMGDESSVKLQLHTEASPAPSIRQSYASHGEKTQPALPLEAIPPKKYLSFGQQAILNGGGSSKKEGNSSVLKPIASSPSSKMQMQPISTAAANNISDSTKK